ncbi:hypothetical protein J6590_023012 [Homalodisca vitripennis]|nr:hypothetical protein J6590_023012 [Homalodisca vitripennis]
MLSLVVVCGEFLESHLKDGNLVRNSEILDKLERKRTQNNSSGRDMSSQNMNAKLRDVVGYPVLQMAALDNYPFSEHDV